MPSRQTLKRRQFLQQSSKATLAMGLGLHALSAKASAPMAALSFQQAPLPYAFGALEPAIDALTMEIHYTKHAAAYAKNAADACLAEKVDTSNLGIESLLANTSRYSAKIRNNAGGHYNHELFWQTLRPPTPNNQPSGRLLQMVQRDFGSFEQWAAQFTDLAKNRFGSGWAWLIQTSAGKLALCSTPNQDNPLMDVAETKGYPLLGLDLWEHAYYLKYQNKRADYIQNWFSLVNWEAVAKRLTQI